MSKKPATPDKTPHELPQTGGSFVRQADGSLILAERTAEPVPRGFTRLTDGTLKVADRDDETGKE